MFSNPRADHVSTSPSSVSNSPSGVSDQHKLVSRSSEDVLSTSASHNQSDFAGNGHSTVEVLVLSQTETGDQNSQALASRTHLSEGSAGTVPDVVANPVSNTAVSDSANYSDDDKPQSFGASRTANARREHQSRSPLSRDRGHFYHDERYEAIPTFA